MSQLTADGLLAEIDELRARLQALEAVIAQQESQRPHLGTHPAFRRGAQSLCSTENPLEYEPKRSASSSIPPPVMSPRSTNTRPSVMGTTPATGGPSSPFGAAPPGQQSMAQPQPQPQPQPVYERGCGYGCDYPYRKPGTHGLSPPVAGWVLRPLPLNFEDPVDRAYITSQIRFEAQQRMLDKQLADIEHEAKRAKSDGPRDPGCVVI